MLFFLQESRSSGPAWLYHADMALQGGQNGIGQCQLTHYEGTEKLLEVWFDVIGRENGEADDNGSSKKPDLRIIPRLVDSTCTVTVVTMN